MGTFTSDWKDDPETACCKCGERGFLEYREWESSCGGYDDYKFRCAACGQDWWSEGLDA